ncbi:uncharacterized protein [Dysidea avara]|uniref:uncharacterized protein n=1 Tax=Dysidea avara TaxID=196820 RepID=UPI0033328128
MSSTEDPATPDQPPTKKSKSDDIDEKTMYKNEARKKGVVDLNLPEGFKDLSTVHVPIGGLFDQPQTGKEWHKYKLTQEQVDSYWTNGYLPNIRVLSEDQCDKLLEDYKVFLDPDKLHPGHGLFFEFHRNQGGDPNNVLLHALGHWRITAAFHDVCFLPAIAVPSSQLIDPSREEVDVRLWHDQLFAKPAKHGGVVAWHQDYSYWTRTKPMKHLTIHIALDDQTVENGGLHFIPGSHRWTRNGMPLPITDDNFADMESIKGILTEEEKADFKPTPSLLKKGEASFHHPLMVHGSYSNRTDKPRRACVVNYFADGVISDTDDPLLSQKEPVIPKGCKMEGQFFPIVYKPQWESVST